jgi:hypothetical protein
MPWSPELETLDQLLACDMRLDIIAQLFPSSDAFIKGILGLLSCGDVNLLSVDGVEIPEWRWRELFRDAASLQELKGLKLRVTPQGTRKVS